MPYSWIRVIRHAGSSHATPRLLVRSGIAEVSSYRITLRAINRTQIESYYKTQLQKKIHWRATPALPPRDRSAAARSADAPATEASVQPARLLGCAGRVRFGVARLRGVTSPPRAFASLASRSAMSEPAGTSPAVAGEDSASRAEYPAD